jgi:hypothetical protein
MMTNLQGSPSNGSEDHGFLQTISLRPIKSYWLVGGLEHVLFSIIYGIILPIDKYFSEGFKPPTSW